MGLHIKKTYYRMFAGSIVVSSLLFSFQNCGQPPLQDSITSASENKDEELEALIHIFGTKEAPKVQGLPFLFDASINQITYSSCNLKGATSPELFTIRAGAYSPISGVRGQAGLKIRDELFSTLGLEFQPKHPNKELTEEDFKRLLFYSPKNKNTKLQFSIRELYNLQKKPQSNDIGLNSVSFEPFDIINSDSYLTSMMNLNLLKQDYSVSYFNFADPTHRQLESYNRLPGVPSPFSITNAEDLVAAQFRQYLNDQNYIFTLNFVKNDNIDEAFSPYSFSENNEVKITRSIYGRGYKFAFGPSKNYFSYCQWKRSLNPQQACSLLENSFTSNVDYPYSASKQPNYYLNNISEIDLETGTPTGKTWNCDSLRKYVIIRDMTDAIDNAQCPPDDISNLSDSQKAYYFQELDIVRQHLPEHAWHVSIYNRCVAPKNSASTCYERKTDTVQGSPNFNKLIPIQYSQLKSCQWFGSEGVNTNTPCAHVISICLRQ